MTHRIPGRRVGATLLASSLLVSGLGSAASAAPEPAYRNASLPVARRVEDLLGRMTLAEKVGQMTQAERASVVDTPSKIAALNLGSVFSGGGSTPKENTPRAWADMVDTFQRQAMRTRLGIPLIYGIDSVHGNGNMSDATLMPHNIGIGATRDPRVAFDTARVAAQETKAVGIPWAFGPCLCSVRDDRWGRVYESYGEDPSLVEAMETSIDGFQGRSLSNPDSVLATVKHFAGDGDTTYGSGRDSAKAYGGDYPIDEGITRQSRSHVAAIDLAPYVPAVKQHHTGSVMPSYSSIDYTDDGLGNPVKMHADRALVQGWLKDKVGFDGFVVGDYNAIHQIPPVPERDAPTAAQVRTAVNAGVDMGMEAATFEQFEKRLTAEVRAGRVSEQRIDDAVRRILTKKFELGLFEHPYVDRAKLATIGDAAHRAVARAAAAKSQVLLKNDAGTLPLRRTGKIYVAGRNANDLGNQAGGWTITWQGMSGTHTKGTTILDGMKQVAPKAEITYSRNATASLEGYDTGVVVVGETPYAEGYGDVGGPGWSHDPTDHEKPRESKSMTLKASDQKAIEKVCSAVKRCVVLTVSGRPQVISKQLPKVDALVASWLPGTEGAGVADVLFGRRPFTGQLPVSWPRTAGQEPLNVGDASYRPLYPFGWGLTTGSHPRSDVASRARSALARGVAGPALVRELRLAVQARRGDGRTGVDPRTAKAVAEADVATLRHRHAEAARILLAVARP